MTLTCWRMRMPERRRPAPETVRSGWRMDLLEARADLAQHQTRSLKQQNPARLLRAFLHSSVLNLYNSTLPPVLSRHIVNIG